MIQRVQEASAAVKELWDRLTSKRPKTTESHLDQERETSVSLGLMERAASAGPAMTPQQQIFLSQSAPGMRDRLAVLLNIPHRSLSQEREKVALEQWLATTSDGPPLVRREEPAKRFGFIPAAAAAHPIMLILLNPITWFVALLAIVGLQTARLGNAKEDLAEAQSDLRAMEHSRDSYASALGAERSARARDVASVLEDTAETVDQLRRREARARNREARERSRREDLERGSVDFTERLRELARPENAGLPADPAAASGGSASGAVPTEPGPNANDGDNP